MYKEGIHFMDYRTILQEENDAVRERLDLSMERVAAMGEEDICPFPELDEWLDSLTAIILDAFPALY